MKMFNQCRHKFLLEKNNWKYGNENVIARTDLGVVVYEAIIPVTKVGTELPVITVIVAVTRVIPPISVVPKVKGVPVLLVVIVAFITIIVIAVAALCQNRQPHYDISKVCHNL
jgi:hypothetical protein